MLKEWTRTVVILHHARPRTAALSAMCDLRSPQGDNPSPGWTTTVQVMSRMSEKQGIIGEQTTARQLLFLG